MGNRPGFFKSCLFGCLGLLVFGFLFAAVSALLAWRGLGGQEFEEAQLAPVAAAGIGAQISSAGRVILALGHGEFWIRPAEPGEGLRVETRYDKEAYTLVDEFERYPDKTWIYSLDFHRTMPGLQALFRVLMGADTENYVHVYLPPDVPIALEIKVEEGGFEADIGGLWITDAAIVYRKGGFEFNVDEPLREPIERLSIRGSMGGFEASRLGNASPRYLDIHCRMGGADVDLGGDWIRDCDVNLSVNMGGMSVRVPQGVTVSGIDDRVAGLRTDVPEIPVPTLRFTLREKMGEVEVLQQ
ncbi:hypothetical protein KKG45_09125 [bacterium]|nr:hypothetical protein [bacterium]MBU1073395.1 hypothetical protein [bacterium]